MRKIKFRVWDKGKMNYIVGNRCLHLYSDGTGGITGKKWSSETKKDEDYTFACFNDEDTYEDKKNIKNSNGIIMQFTGLEDKNGKEIYEGDIIKFILFNVDGNKIILNGTIIFKEGEFIIKYGTSHHFSLRLAIQRSDYKPKVVGNIFENSELLEIKNGHK